MRLFHDTNIDFLGQRKKFYLVSVIIIAIGMTILFTKGIPLGIDFQGGTELQVRFQNTVDISEIRNIMDQSDMPGMEIKSLGTDKDVLLRTPMQGEGTTVSDKIQEAFKSKIQNNKYEVLRIDKVGPKIGAELRKNAMLAVVFSLIGIFIYLAFRFQFIYALGAIIALAHDVLITLSAVAISDFIFPGLRLEFNQQMLAAFLTLVGFSVNDTVIIFDRIRENIKLFKTEDIEHVMNRSVNATLSRTIITGGTVLLTILVLFLFGGEVNRAFSFTFGIGIITGTYSSVFIAAAVVVDYTHKFHLKNVVTTKGKTKLAKS
ncbi:protein translocase subunit SecF [soil metagenome]